MIVKKMESPVYHRRRRESLPGRGVESRSLDRDKSFEQFLLEAFRGELVQEGKSFSKTVSPLTKENLIRLSKT